MTDTLKQQPDSSATSSHNTDNTAVQSITLPFRFTGNTREYFGIWIMNILFTILTLGIYSAWAKVRTNRYFYGNTLLDDAPFDYLANPIAILKGWAIAIAAFAVYSIAIHFVPATQPIFMLLFFILLPWLVVRALAFRLYNTSYRNLRFHFNRNYRQAVKIFFGFGLLVPLTLGLMIPSYVYRQKRFIIDHSHYGKSRFQFKALESKFYETYGIAIAILIAGGVLFSALIPLVAHLFTGAESEAVANMAAPGKHAQPPLAIMVLLFAGMGLVYLFFFAFINTRIYNVIWNGTQIAGNRFHSSLKVKTMAWLYLSNALAIMFTFGLMIPWARIRMARYKLGNLALQSQGNLENFIAGEKQQVSATGEELGEVFDFDIGI